MNLLVGESKCIVIAPDCCKSVKLAGSVGLSMNPLHLTPGHRDGGYLHVDIGLHERNVCGLMMSILLSGSSIVYEVKPLTSTSSCALLSKSKIENSKRGSVTSSPVSECSNVNVMFTYVPDCTVIIPKLPMHPLKRSCSIPPGSGMTGDVALTTRSNVASFTIPTFA